ncbi:MAG: hypothetical protein KJ621_04150 [Proteobacteria bacterium]|nr:hypothetical protein [Pseudomonadota bacterium]
MSNAWRRLLTALVVGLCLASTIQAGTVTDVLRAVKAASGKKDAKGLVALFPRLNYLHQLQTPPGGRPVTPAMARALQAARKRFFGFALAMLGSIEDPKPVDRMKCPIKVAGSAAVDHLDLALVQVRHPWPRFVAAWKSMSRRDTPQVMSRLERELKLRGDLVKVGPKRYVYSLLVLARLTPATRALFQRLFGWKNKRLADGSWVLERFHQRSAGRADWKSLKAKLKCR